MRRAVRRPFARRSRSWRRCGRRAAGTGRGDPGTDSPGCRGTGQVARRPAARGCPPEAGPGVRGVRSPRVPSAGEAAGPLRTGRATVPAERLRVAPGPPPGRGPYLPGDPVAAARTVRGEPSGPGRDRGGHHGRGGPRSVRRRTPGPGPPSGPAPPVFRPRRSPASARSRRTPCGSAARAGWPGPSDRRCRRSCPRGARRPRRRSGRRGRTARPRPPSRGPSAPRGERGGRGPRGGRWAGRPGRSCRSAWWGSGRERSPGTGPCGRGAYGPHGGAAPRRRPRNRPPSRPGGAPPRGGSHTPRPGPSRGRPRPARTRDRPRDGRSAGPRPRPVRHGSRAPSPGGRRGR
ncbi:5-methyltetrahydropteroyltriglutamate--homocysteine methyltransferase [Streptomyces clavuligerus]|uniref:5-methyltetrahydropteroyltriglutamate--homocysteine methyltransferase n=1 Tax=Streptomyces clavuligerus TaxID=1901 RepID=E2Q2J5_STRCL|nr:5-methyltetrahydropteroyltriglutamate--homocysteine methyltransferase [Streptomyces clavuligerus]